MVFALLLLPKYLVNLFYHQPAHPHPTWLAPSGVSGLDRMVKNFYEKSLAPSLFRRWQISIFIQGIGMSEKMEQREKEV